MSERYFDDIFKHMLEKGIKSYTKYSDDIAELLRFIPGLEDVTSIDVDKAIMNTRISPDDD